LYDLIIGFTELIWSTQDLKLILLSYTLKVTNGYIFYHFAWLRG
jgi:hypothetical protein